MRLLLVMTVLGGMACGEAQSERCRKVCQQEADCAESRDNPSENFPYDADECVVACMGLERDTASKKIVDDHIECAKKAGSDCDALKRCR